MRLFRPTYTARHAFDAGAVLGAPYVKRTRRVSAVWWVEFTVNGTPHRLSTGLRDRNAAEVKAAALLRDAELRAAGIETHAETRAAGMAPLLAEYRADMTRRGLAPKHVATTLARCETLVQGCATVADLSPAQVRLGLERLRGASAKTINGYRTALHGFCAWLVREGRWAANPVEAVAPARVVADGPARRALTPEEQVRLLSVRGPHDATGVCYRVALCTGLRRAELAALRGRDVFFDEQRRFSLRLPGRSAKNRTERVLPLPLGLDLPIPPPEARLLYVPTLAQFRSDLREAAIPETTPEGKVDFHALRVSYATNLARAGVPLTLAQKLMRHSDPALTSNIYTRLGIDSEREAVDRASAGCVS